MKKLRFRLILPLLFALMLTLGSCMTVCAASGYTPYCDLVFPDEYTDLGYNYYFECNTGYFQFFSCDSPISVDVSSEADRQKLRSDCSSYMYCTISPDGSFSKFCNGSGSFSLGAFLYIDFIYASADVYNTHSGTKELFFRSPLARLAVPLKGEVLKQTKVILPVGVGCLALLTGSAVLLPRLRRSLLRL